MSGPLSIKDLQKKPRKQKAASVEERLHDERGSGRRMDGRSLRAGGATVQLNVRLPEATKADVYALAKELDVTIAEVIVRAVGIMKGGSRE